MLYLDGNGSLQQQVANALRTAITQGQLRQDTRLPATRMLAAELEVSRNTVVAAYEQLCAEGYANSRQGAGTFVAAGILTDLMVARAKPIAPVWSQYAATTADSVPDKLAFRQPKQKLRYNFLYGEPGYADLPIERWARILGKKARDLTENQLGYAPTGGLPELRAAIADYLQRARGVSCTPEQVLVVQGTQEAIDLVTRAFVDPGATAVIEEPHYRGFERCLLAAGANIVAIPVDESGLQTRLLEAVKGARVVYTTPSHQFPTGSIMSLARRTELLEWAVANKTVVMEDDYDGEFRYEGRPIPALQSLDQNDCVVYVGTASKILFPSLRLGWMVVPASMVGMFERLKTLADTNPSTLEQLAFAEFIIDGHLERHLHWMRKQHRHRRAALLRSLNQALGDKAEVVGTEAGIHILLRLPTISSRYTDRIVELAKEANVGVYPSSLYYARQPPECVELILGYASLTPGQIRTGLKRLAKVIISFLDGQTNKVKSGGA
jgi:GntR family transcriptional regulator/MocR family aminotransferase